MGKNKALGASSKSEFASTGMGIGLFLGVLAAGAIATGVVLGFQADRQQEQSKMP